MDRLKVLIFIPPKIDAVAINHELSTRLAHGLEDFADVDLHASAHSIDAATLSKYDIIHVLGCWNMASIKLLHKAYKLHIPTVYTLLGGLQPWIAKKYKTTYNYKFQKTAIQKASAIHLCSKLEFGTFKQLDWNKHYVLIKNPVLTSQVSFEQMCDLMLKLYQKVIDTNARLLLSPTSTEVIGNLLQLGIDKEVLFDHKHCTSVKGRLEQLSALEWRRIMLYADEELITEYIIKGLERLQYQVPEIAIEEIDRFPRNQNYLQGDLQSDALCFKSSTLKAKLSASIKETEINERILCIELLNFKYELERHQTPLRHLANIYTSLRFNNMDEDRLNELVKLLDIREFSARLMTVLHNILRLSEGFMPFTPKEDRTSKVMARNITKFNTW
jgi:hypothetical protein